MLLARASPSLRREQLADPVPMRQIFVLCWITKTARLHFSPPLRRERRSHCRHRGGRGWPPLLVSLTVRSSFISRPAPLRDVLVPPAPPTLPSSRRRRPGRTPQLDNRLEISLLRRTFSLWWYTIPALGFGRAHPASVRQCQLAGYRGAHVDVPGGVVRVNS